ncbi:MAG: type II toxin-antitoxin system VapC family toxin [Chloroflexi bacterium]|nr:type II toxin-antitoxin system VapC family toxin [Chloroflexota bacterium]
MAGREKVYWDACIFIAHLNNEHRADPLDMQGVGELVRLIDQEQLEIVTSTITIVEVLESRIQLNAYEIFREYFGRRNVHLLDVTREIAELSHEIRDYYQDDSSGLTTVSTPDAIHLATAITFECDIFHTFDEINRPTRPRALIPLPQPIAGRYAIPIQKPTPGQLALGLIDRKGEDEESE